MEQAERQQQAEKRTRVLGEGPLARVLVSMSLPGIVGMTVNAFYNVTDSAFIGRLGTAQIGAVAVVFPLLTLVGAIGLTFGVGAASYISRSLGAGRRDEASRTATVALAGTVLSSIVFSVVSYQYIDELLVALGASETVLPYARSYAEVFLFGASALMLKQCLAHCIRAEGAARYSMAGLVLGAVLNIILDPIFIFVLDLGIAGAAYATILSQVVAVVFLSAHYVRGRSYVHVGPASLRPDRTIVREVIGNGGPLFFRLLLETVAFGIINSFARPHGDAALGAIGIVFRVLLFASFPVYGFGQGYGPVVGYNYGAKQYARLMRAIRLGYIWSSIYALLVAALVVSMAPWIMRIFTTDPEVIAIGSWGLRVIHGVFPLFGLQTVALFTCQALGKSKPAYLIGIARQGIFLIPIVFVLSGLFGLDGVIASQAVADVLTAMLGAVFMITTTRYLHREQRQNSLSGVSDGLY